MCLSSEGMNTDSDWTTTERLKTEMVNVQRSMFNVQISAIRCHVTHKLPLNTSRLSNVSSTYHRCYNTARHKPFLDHKNKTK